MHACARKGATEVGSAVGEEMSAALLPSWLAGCAWLRLLAVGWRRVAHFPRSGLAIRQARATVALGTTRASRDLIGLWARVTARGDRSPFASPTFSPAFQVLRAGEATLGKGMHV